MIFIISKSFLKVSKSERFRELHLMNKFLFAEKCKFLQMMCFHAVLSERDGLNIVPSRKTTEIQVHYTLYYPRANIIFRSARFNNEIVVSAALEFIHVFALHNGLTCI